MTGWCWSDSIATIDHRFDRLLARQLLERSAAVKPRLTLPLVPVWSWDEAILARSEVSGLQVHPTLPVSYQRVSK